MTNWGKARNFNLNVKFCLTPDVYFFMSQFDTLLCFKKRREGKEEGKGGEERWREARREGNKERGGKRMEGKRKKWKKERKSGSNLYFPKKYSPACMCLCNVTL